MTTLSSQVESVETAWPSKTLGELYVRRASVDPAKHSDESFDLFSVPAYERRVPDELTGSEIGSSKVTVEPGDTLLCRIVPHIRRAWVVPPGGGARQIASGEWMVLRHPDVDSGFLRQLLLSDPFHDKFMSTVAGVGGSLMRARPAHAASIRIPLPPLPEQRRIADILDRADDLRAKRRRALALLDELEGEFFGYTFESDRRDTVALGKIADVVSGITKGRKAPAGPLRTVPYLAVSNVQAGHLNMSVVKTIDAAESEIDRLRLQPDDLLLTEGGDPDKLGRGTLWANELLEAIHQNHIYRVRVHDRRIQPVFLNWFVRSDSARKYFLRSAKQTTGIASINMTQLRALPVNIPSENLQRVFVARVNQIATLRKSHEIDLAKLDELFASLQHRAFDVDSDGRGQIDDLGT